MAERFFATLKKELVHDAARRTRQEARAGLFEYIEVWYYRNRRRPTRLAVHRRVRRKTIQERSLTTRPLNRVNFNLPSTRPLPKECSMTTVRARRATLAAAAATRPL